MSMDLEELKKLALAATPGPWSWWTSNSVLRLSGADRKDGGVICATMHAHWPDIMVNWQNREYLAAANPQTVLALIAELAAVRQELEEANQIFSWLLGTNGEFPFRQEGEGAYWWRKELRERLSAARQQSS